MSTKVYLLQDLLCLFSITGVKLEILHFKEAEVNLLLQFALNYSSRASRELSVTLFAIDKNYGGEGCSKVACISLPVKTHYISWAELRKQNWNIFMKYIYGTFCSAHCYVDI